MSSTIFEFPVPAKIVFHENETYSVGIETMKIALERCKVPLIMPSYPETFLAPLGACIVQWGAFEELHNSLLFSLADYNRTPRAELRRGFEQRRKAFKKEAKKAFPRCPGLLAYISDILGRAKVLYRDRNLLSHGQLSGRLHFNFPDGTPDISRVAVSVSAQGYVDDQEVVKEFTIQDLEKLFYELAHLGGLLNELESSTPQVPLATSHEISTLLEFQRKALPPKPSMLPSPLQT